MSKLSAHIDLMPRIGTVGKHGYIGSADAGVEVLYQNVIITDSQSMSSITDHYSAGEAAVQALAAGCDMILMPSDLQGAFDAVKAAVADGTLTQSRIDESVLRILTVKAEYGILQ